MSGGAPYAPTFGVYDELKVQDLSEQLEMWVRGDFIPIESDLYCTTKAHVSPGEALHRFKDCRCDC